MDPIFYKLFRGSSIAAFAIAVITHIFSLFGIALLPPLTCVLLALVFVNGAFALILQYSNPQLWQLISKNLLIHRLIPEYYKVTLNFWYRDTPLWTRLTSIGIVLYLFVQMALLMQADPPELRQFASAPSLRLETAVLAAFYWQFIWFWNAQLVRAEKSVDEEADSAPPPQ